MSFLAKLGRYGDFGAMAFLFASLFPSMAGAFELEEITISQLQEGLKSGKYSSRSIVEMYLKRIEEIDRKGPGIRSVIEINPDARQIADQMDKERREGKSRGPLHGIPILIKENIGTADGMQTTAGSYALENLPVKQDAFVAQKLRKAGAVILGKTNMSEWAYFRSTRASSGWSARGGQTKNPYILTRSPCGSSSGSGAAIAANLAPASLGTETDGSIVCPASANSLVGIKTTMGLVSRAGVVPGAHSQDVVGPLARTVADAAILLGAIVGPDPRDPVTEAAKDQAQSDYARFLDRAGLKGARIGIARNYFGYHEKVDALINQSIEIMKQQGAVIVDPANVETAGQFGGCEVTTFIYELKADLGKYLQERSPSGPQSLKDLIAFNEKNRQKEMPYFEQEFFKMSEDKGGPLTDQAYQDAVKECRRLAGAAGLDTTLKRHNVDVVVAPTMGPVMPIDLVIGDHLVPPWATPHWAPSVAAVAGYPHISVPAGYVSGVPVGISFMGAAWSEPMLIRVAYAFEQATKHRKPPQFVPTDPTH